MAGRDTSFLRALLYFEGNFYGVETPDDGTDYGYGRTWLTTELQTLQFTVKACHDAHIMLTAVPGDYHADDAYEVVLGGNSNKETYIRRGYKVTVNLRS